MIIEKAIRAKAAKRYTVVSASAALEAAERAEMHYCNAVRDGNLELSKAYAADARKYWADVAKAARIQSKSWALQRLMTVTPKEGK